MPSWGQIGLRALSYNTLTLTLGRDEAKSISAAHTYKSEPSATGASMMLRASVDFADAWYAFLRQEHGDSTRTFTMQLDASRFPHAFAKRVGLKVTGIRMVLATSEPANMTATLTLPSDDEMDEPTNCNFVADEGVFDGHMLAAWDGEDSPGTFTLSVAENSIPEDLAVAYSDLHAVFALGAARRQVLRQLMSLPPGTTQVTINPVNTGGFIGRGYPRIGSSNPSLVRFGPLQLIDDLTHVQGTFRFNPTTGTWDPITIFPVRTP